MRAWVSGVCGVMIGCGDDATTNEPKASCALVGGVVDLPVASNFDVAAAADGWVIVLADSEGVGSLTLSNDGVLGARESVSLPASSTLSATSAGGVVYVTSPAQATFDGLRIATRVDGVWTTAKEPDVEGPTTFDYGSTITASGDKVAVVWISGTATGDEALYVTDYVAGVFTTTAVPAGGLPELVGNEVEAAFAGDGTLWVVVGADDGIDFSLYAYARDSTGTWSRAQDLGALDGAFANISIAGMASDDAGHVRLALVEPASFIDGTNGGPRVIGVDDGTSGGGPSDDRPVVEGVDVAAMPGFGVLATASWGANNFDPAQSRDSLLLYACGDSCRQVLAVDAVNGTFYGRAKLATSGQRGVVVYQREAKGANGVERTVAQRFECALPE